MGLLHEVDEWEDADAEAAEDEEADAEEDHVEHQSVSRVAALSTHDDRLRWSARLEVFVVDHGHVDSLAD